jgi:prefoldin beta subunit
MLKEGSNVYKLVGPVLISVDLQEAKENVNKRLQFIEGEVSKVEGSIGDVNILMLIQYIQ